MKSLGVGGTGVMTVGVALALVTERALLETIAEQVAASTAWAFGMIRVAWVAVA